MKATMITADPYQWQKRLLKALLEGDAFEASRVVEELIAARRSMADVYLKLISPVMSRIGDLWAEGSIGVGQEKLATQIVLQLMDRLRVSPGAANNRGSAARVLVSCVQGEDHLIGARMVADLFMAQGWSVDFLGADVPDDALLQMVKSQRPQLVAISATAQSGIEHARWIIGALGELPDPPKVLFGGQAFQQVCPGKQDKVVARVVRDVSEGLAAARSLLSLHRKAVLREYLLAVGGRVRERRLKAGLTQEQLAEAARVTRVCIVAVEGGKQNVSMDVIVRIANALEVSPERLLVSTLQPGLTRRGED